MLLAPVPRRDDALYVRIRRKVSSLMLSGKIVDDTGISSSDDIHDPWAQRPVRATATMGIWPSASGASQGGLDHRGHHEALTSRARRSWAAASTWTSRPRPRSSAATTIPVITRSYVSVGQQLYAYMLSSSSRNARSCSEARTTSSPRMYTFRPPRGRCVRRVQSSEAFAATSTSRAVQLGLIQYAQPVQPEAACRRRSTP
jgi:hypothetical protein